MSHVLSEQGSTSAHSSGPNAHLLANAEQRTQVANSLALLAGQEGELAQQRTELTTRGEFLDRERAILLEWQASVSNGTEPAGQTVSLDGGATQASVQAGAGKRTAPRKTDSGRAAERTKPKGPAKKAKPEKTAANPQGTVLQRVQDFMRGKTNPQSVKEVYSAMAETQSEGLSLPGVRAALQTLTQKDEVRRSTQGPSVFYAWLATD